MHRWDLLGLETVSADDIWWILDTAKSMSDIMTRDIKKVPTLRGKCVCTLFFEPSTRTRSSFELACKYLSADTLSFATATSSVRKGETLADTALNIQAMGVDAVVIRHQCSGAPHYLAQKLKCPVINAGDGMHEHPTQALLDIYTMREHGIDFPNAKIAIIGDIAHSRVARSNAWGLTKLGAKVVFCGPPTLMPPDVSQFGVEVTYDADEAVRDADVVYMLRLQLERQAGGLFPSIREYRELYGLNKRRLALAKPGALVMHPGPMNRGVEIESDVADGAQSVILEQVTAGVIVRMAVLFRALGGGSEWAGS